MGDSDLAVTPEGLLRMLLGSQTQSTDGSVDDVFHPTRLRALQALRDEVLGVPDLADRIGVGRQAAYRVLEPCHEAGLVRRVETGYTLSCSGGAVLRVYRKASETIQRDALIQMARSRNQLWLLNTLQNAPAEKATLARIGRQGDGPSRTTIHRIVDRLVDGSYVVRRSGAYELTETGQRLLETYSELRNTIEQALSKREFLRWLPTSLDLFPIHALGEATLIQNSPRHPHNVLNSLLRVADPDLETFEGMATIVSPPIAQAYRQVLAGGTQVTGVFPDEVLFGLHRDREFIDYVTEQGFTSYIREGLTASDVELSFIADTPPIHLAIYDGTRVIISLAPSTGVTDAEASAIDSTDPVIVDWATELFETYHAESRPPLRAFLDRTLGYDPGNQYPVGD